MNVEFFIVAYVIKLFLDKIKIVTPDTHVTYKGLEYDSDSSIVFMVGMLLSMVHGIVYALFIIFATINSCTNMHIVTFTLMVSFPIIDFIQYGYLNIKCVLGKMPVDEDGYACISIDSSKHMFYEIVLLILSKYVC